MATVMVTSLLVTSKVSPLISILDLPISCLEHQTIQFLVLRILFLVEQLAPVDTVTERRQPGSVGAVGSPVAVFEEAGKVFDVNGAVLDQNTASHAVEQGVGKVVCRCLDVLGALCAVGHSNQAVQPI